VEDLKVDHFLVVVEMVLRLVCDGPNGLESHNEEVEG